MKIMYQSAEGIQVNKDGMFPGAKCCSCKKELNADGNHPAEAYAGTYNGLCYPCTDRSIFVLAKCEGDGALLLSHPPLVPAHSRQRDLFLAYEDCPECNGVGCTGQNLTGSVGGRSRITCHTCYKKAVEHPVRSRFIRNSDKLAQSANSVLADAWGKIKEGQPEETLDNLKRLTSMAITLRVLDTYERMTKKMEEQGFIFQLVDKGHGINDTEEVSRFHEGLRY